MKLPISTVRSFKDIQQNFEELLKAFNKGLLFSLAGDIRGVGAGNNTATWTAATASAVKTVTHGLRDPDTGAGKTPRSLTVVFDTIGSGQHAHGEVGNVGATTFDVVGVSPAAFTGTLGFYWIATS